MKKTIIMVLSLMLMACGGGGEDCEEFVGPLKPGSQLPAQYCERTAEGDGT